VIYLFLCSNRFSKKKTWKRFLSIDDHLHPLVLCCISGLSVAFSFLSLRFITVAQPVFRSVDWTFVLGAPANDEIAAPRRPMACPLHDVICSEFTRF